MLEHESLRKIKGLFNYKDAKKINTLSFLTYVLFISQLIAADKSILSLGITGATWLSSYLLNLSTSVGTDDDFKDVKNVKKIYDQVLENYVKLNKQFELQNPVELFTMFCYMYSNGYLSKERVFKYDAGKLYDIYSLYGTNVINGKGCCRHITSMFTDVLKLYEMESYVLPVNTIFNIEDMKIVEEINHLFINRKQLKKDKIDIELEINSRIDKLIQDSDKKKEYISKSSGKELLRLVGNHAITMSVYEGKNFFLDPTNFCFISRLNNNQLINYFDEKMFIVYDNMHLYNKSFDVDKVKEQVLLPETTYIENLRMLASTNKICEEYQSDFEIFYNQNKEAYEEIASKLVKIKKLKK